MLVTHDIKSLTQTILSWKKSGLSVGFVPTMGSLHAGHTSLLLKAKEQNDKVICSIFINPTQFNNKKDLQNYPRDLQKDMKLLKTIGCDLAFNPKAETMYPEGEQCESFKEDIQKFDETMEGASRPGHFDGVCMIIHKLFNFIKPTSAYFGEKDFQQLAIVKTLTKNRNYGVKIIGCPTIREKNGLALSSRNSLLSDSDKIIASKIYQILLSAKTKYQGTKIASLKEEVRNQIFSEPRFKLDYLEIVNKVTLIPIKEKAKENAVICIAVFLGKVRLIDNMLLN